MRDDIEIKKLTEFDGDDFVELVEIFHEVFEHEGSRPSKSYLAGLLKNPRFFVMVAKRGGKVIGGLTVFVLELYYDEKPTAYIYDVGVRPDQQGQGTGTALMARVREYCRENGFRDAYVEAETEETDVLRFYRQTKPSSEMEATHFTYSFD